MKQVIIKTCSLYRNVLFFLIVREISPTIKKGRKKRRDSIFRYVWQSIFLYLYYVPFLSIHCTDKSYFTNYNYIFSAIRKEVLMICVIKLKFWDKKNKKKITIVFLIFFKTSIYWVQFEIFKQIHFFSQRVIKIQKHYFLFKGILCLFSFMFKTETNIKFATKNFWQYKFLLNGGRWLYNKYFILF